MKWNEMKWNELSMFLWFATKLAPGFFWPSPLHACPPNVDDKMYNFDLELIVSFEHRWNTVLVCFPAARDLYRMGLPSYRSWPGAHGGVERHTASLSVCHLTCMVIAMVTSHVMSNSAMLHCCTCRAADTDIQAQATAGSGHFPRRNCDDVCSPAWVNHTQRLNSFAGLGAATCIRCIFVTNKSTDPL